MSHYTKVVLVISLFTASCNKVRNGGNTGVSIQHPFFGVEPDETPRLLAPGLIASAAEEYNGTFSAEGTQFYYTTDIPENAFIAFTELMEDNTWSEPKVASFSGTYPDYDPLFSPDGKRLYFSSRRPPFDNLSRIWYVEQLDEGWSEPKYVALADSENQEYYSSVTRSGNIYFNIWATGNIYRAQKADTNYLVEELPEVVNADYDKGDPFISPDEDYLIFRGYREDSYGEGDLYITFNSQGNWTKPENLGEPINSSSHESCPYVTPDGFIFIFASSRLVSEVELKPLKSIKTVREKYQTYDNAELNIYYVSTSFINDLRDKHFTSKD